MNNDHHPQPEFHDAARTGNGRRTDASAAHRRSGPAGGGRSGGRHGRNGGLHRGGGRPTRKTTLLAVASVVVVGGSCVLLIRPDSGADRALAADGAAQAAPAATTPASPEPSVSRSPKSHKPAASPSAERHRKRHATPRPKPSRTGGSAEPAKSVTPRAARPGSGTGGGAPAGTGAAKGTAAAFAQKIVELVNAQRAQHGCGPLSVDRRITAAAQAHSDDMAARNYYEHNTPEGVDPGTRMTKAGFPWASWAENIFKSPKDPATAMDGWMKSPGHRDNILNCSYKSTGVGVNLSANGPWWTQDFATHS
ncbi:CAP domain-containing protein [Streptomyces angustmyceticus]|uniref:CAP domain-containing protein n=1 Tax=Streptomyces angustmyceticus TaxID=285578 RepID=UPI0036A2599A